MQLRLSKIKWMTEKVEDFPLEAVRDWYFDHHVKKGSHTDRAKNHDFASLFEFCLVEMQKPPYVLCVGDLSPELLNAWVDWLVEKEEAASTVNRRMATVRHFCRAIKARVPYWVDPTESFRDFPIERAFKGIEPEIQTQLVEAGYKVGTSHFMRMRTGITVELKLGLGIRADELINLCVGQISPDGKWFRKVICKGRKTRNVYIHEELRVKLGAWLAVRERALTEAFAGYEHLSDARKAALPLLPVLSRSTLKKPDSFFMDYKTLWRAFAETAKKADCEHISPHRFRHAYAHNLLEATEDIRLVAQALGHSDVKTTMIYTERSEDKLAAALESARKK